MIVNGSDRIDHICVVGELIEHTSVIWIPNDNIIVNGATS